MAEVLYTICDLCQKEVANNKYWEVVLTRQDDDFEKKFDVCYYCAPLKLQASRLKQIIASLTGKG